MIFDVTPDLICMPQGIWSDPVFLDLIPIGGLDLDDDNMPIFFKV